MIWKDTYTFVTLVIVVIVVIVVIAAGGVFLYQNPSQSSLQPNIQLFANQNSWSATTFYPINQTVVDSRRVSAHGTFVYTASGEGHASLVFNNTSPTFGNTSSAYYSRYVRLVYAIGVESGGSDSFSVGAGTSAKEDFALYSGQEVSGSFTVSGDSGNDVYFSVVSERCSETLSFLGHLVNSGNSSGFATVSLQVDGRSFWSNRYLVENGQGTWVSDHIIIPYCLKHQLDLVLTQQQKA